MASRIEYVTWAHDDWPGCSECGCDLQVGTQVAACSTTWAFGSGTHSTWKYWCVACQKQPLIAAQIMNLKVKDVEQALE